MTDDDLFIQGDSSALKWAQWRLGLRDLTFLITLFPSCPATSPMCYHLKQNWGRQWSTQNINHPTQVLEKMNHPVVKMVAEGSVWGMFWTVSGYDTQETIVKLLADSEDSGSAVGVDCSTGETISPADHGILDNYNVKRQGTNSIAKNCSLKWGFRFNFDCGIRGDTSGRTKPIVDMKTKVLPGLSPCVWKLSFFTQFS